MWWQRGVSIHHNDHFQYAIAVIAFNAVNHSEIINSVPRVGRSFFWLEDGFGLVGHTPAIE